MAGHRAIEIGVVGLGQCGGNLAVEFASRGYRACALNTSHNDLRVLSGLDEDKRLFIGKEGMNGTGGNLGRGAECVGEHGDQIIEHVESTLGGSEILIVAAGLGGGTGGNLADLINLLSRRGHGVIALGVLPAASESYAVKVNALQALNEILDTNFESLVLVDNQKLFTSFASSGIGQFLREGNSVVAQTFDQLNSLSQNDELTSIRAFDPIDLKQILFSGGVTVFGSRDLDDVNAGSLSQAANDILNDNEFLATGFEPADIVELGSVITASQDSLADTPATVFEEFVGKVKETTGGAAHHAGIYGSQGGAARLYLLAGGLPLPARAEALLAEATEEAQRQQKKKASRKKLQKLDLSALGVTEKDAPAGNGKGMARSEGAPVEEEVVGDLDFAEEPMVEEMIGDGAFEEEMVEEEF